MQCKLIKKDNKIYRILDLNDDYVFVIDCVKRTMPKWIKADEIESYDRCTEEEFRSLADMTVPDIKTLSLNEQKNINEKFNVIAEILPCVSDYKTRTQKIKESALAHNLNKQTIRKYLCLYLVYQTRTVFLPKKNENRPELSRDEKNMRWALNKFFYTQNKNSLKTAYVFMLKNRYCDENGGLAEDYPTFYQFRYFYRKTKNMQNYYISRNGLKNYQRNNRPLLGDGVHAFAQSVGKGMIDSTICDIYLVNNTGDVIGRPVLTACVDAYSGLCCGYSLSWEGGIYSLKKLMLNIITDKTEYCKSFGIDINSDDWNCDKLPSTLVTDMGSEYKSENLEQLSELGITIVNLPSYRPELKGCIEKFFDIIQNLFKPYLKGKGVIEPDFQERGAHDYRKDACLTLNEFEKIILHCIIFYNSKRVINSFPYTENMLKNRVKPISSQIWIWCIGERTANLIQTDSRQLMLTLLPRVQGTFTRFGLKVGKLHYRHDDYTEMYLKGGNVTAAYNPENAADVWLIDNGRYIKFNLIEERFTDRSLLEVESQYKQKYELAKETANGSLQAQIDLSKHIEAIALTAAQNINNNLKNIRDTRKKERNATHIDYVKAGEIYD